MIWAIIDHQTAKAGPSWRDFRTINSDVEVLFHDQVHIGTAVPARGFLPEALQEDLVLVWRCSHGANLSPKRLAESTQRTG